MRSLLLIPALITALCGHGQVHFDQAMDEYMNRSADTAIVMFTQVIAQGEQLACSYQMRGAAKVWTRDFVGARADLDVSKSLDSTDHRLYFCYGRLCMMQNQGPEALAYFNIALAMDSMDADVWDSRGLCKFFAGDLAGNLQDENMAIKLDSTDELFFSNRGWSLLSLGKRSEAIADFNASLNVKPNQRAYANRGIAYAQSGKPLQAIDDYTNALTFEPDDGMVLYYRGLEYGKLREDDKACADFKRSAALGYAKGVNMAQFCP